jgi:hypothetical protein
LAGAAPLAFVALLAVVPASELVIQLLQRVISSLIPPRRLPRIELDACRVGAHDGDRPTLLDSVERVEELIAHLEVQALGNLDPTSTSRCSATSRTPPARRMPQDAEILEAARAGIARSTPSTATAAGDRFFLFHRLRQWNAREGLWMGGSASAARSRSSTGCCAAPPTRASPSRSATCRSCRRQVLHHARQRHALPPRHSRCELIGIITHR